MKIQVLNEARSFPVKVQSFCGNVDKKEVNKVVMSIQRKTEKNYKLLDRWDPACIVVEPDGTSILGLVTRDSTWYVRVFKNFSDLTSFVKTNSYLTQDLASLKFKEVAKNKFFEIFYANPGQKKPEISDRTEFPEEEVKYSFWWAYAGDGRMSYVAYGADTIGKYRFNPKRIAKKLGENHFVSYWDEDSGRVTSYKTLINKLNDKLRYSYHNTPFASEEELINASKDDEYFTA